MSINHHPGEELLLEYITGALTESWSLAVATHLSFCAKCRKDVSDMEALGGIMLESMPTMDVRPAMMADILEKNQDAKLDDYSVVKNTTISERRRDIPAILQTYLGGTNNIEWKKLGFGVTQNILPTSDNSAIVRLLKIPGGRSILEHSHNGPELTVVLSGQFCDQTGYYAQGDFQQTDETIKHKPQTVGNEPCVCLSVTNAPLEFSGVVGRLLQPFLGI